MRNMCKHTNKVILGIDIGGSHISSALINAADGSLIEETLCKSEIDTKSKSIKIILDQWMQTIRDTLFTGRDKELKGIGIAMPGPFNYEDGISLLNGNDKYEALYGINVKNWIENELGVPVLFENDAACFALGEALQGGGACYKNMVAITLGTGFGASFIRSKNLVTAGPGIPRNGYLYDIPFKEGVAEDYISSRWLIKKYNELSGKNLSNAKEIAELAKVENDNIAQEVFRIFGSNLGQCLAPWLRSFKANCLVIGGSIGKSAELFLPALTTLLLQEEIDIPIKISKKMELSAIAGAAGLVENASRKMENNKQTDIWRKSSQNLLPYYAGDISNKPGEYNLYPFYSLERKEILAGYQSLAEWILDKRVVAIDGYSGVDWPVIQQNLSEVFKKKNLKVLWYDTSAFRKDEIETEVLVRPFLGKKNAVWGTKTTLQLQDFYHKEKFENINWDEDFDATILIGTGAGLCDKNIPLIYVDLPKNEIQYRMRAGSIYNLGTCRASAPSEMYKRFYFVDWVVLNKHRNTIKERIAVIADGQWKTNITWALSDSIFNGLKLISKSIIRVRPWFEAGAWGGQWMKEHIAALNEKEINYAWSFELIVPENGLVFESDGNLLEIAFDWLMESNSKEVLGEDSEQFGIQFPIRFDFLDTFDGGNLSIQCHPSLQYIQENFGETITQDETYYILDCKKDAGVYLGFQEGINSNEFRNVLEKSEQTDTPVEIEKYVQWHPAHKHDLFLISNGTIHSSGINNLVLEISATPYIFTFKMYDWVRLDLEGNPRPINIEHAFNNLKFDRQGQQVKEELISRPALLEKNDQYTIIHLPTHKEHFYDVHRIEFSREAEIKTKGKCHVLMLVEGTCITVQTLNGFKQSFNYAETFIIPAAVESYKLLNETGNPVKVIKAFIKPMENYKYSLHSKE